MKNYVFIVAAGFVALLGKTVPAAEMPMMNHGGGRMMMDMQGRMVMGQNTDRLPDGCRKVSEDVKITVHAGHQYSKPYPGTIFGYSEHQWLVKPCARVTVTLVNDDHVRHQWMLHGLPEELYPMEMFHVEVTGPGDVTGTFIVPKENQTYLVHCDIAQHTEKGMKAQLIVGEGSGVLPGIPGVSNPLVVDDYTGQGERRTQSQLGLAMGNNGGESSWLSGMMVLGFVAAILAAPHFFGFLGKRMFGMSGKEVSAYFFDRLLEFFCYLLDLLSALIALIRSPKKL